MRNENSNSYLLTPNSSLLTKQKPAEIFFESLKPHALILLVKFLADAVRRIIDLVFAVGRRRENNLRGLGCVGEFVIAREKIFALIRGNFFVTRQIVERRLEICFRAAGNHRLDENVERFELVIK